jgi:hypothetical protein
MFGNTGKAYGLRDHYGYPRPGRILAAATMAVTALSALVVVL